VTVSEWGELVDSDSVRAASVVRVETSELVVIPQEQAPPVDAAGAAQVVRADPGAVAAVVVARLDLRPVVLVEEAAAREARVVEDVAAVAVELAGVRTA
jgi:hypothetical protein